MRPTTPLRTRRRRIIAGATDGRSRVFLIVTVAVILAAGIAVASWMMHARLNRPQSRPPLGAEARDYLKQITVTDAHMSAARNLLGNTVTYLDARVTNDGTRTVHQVDLQLQFTDMLNQVVLGDVARPIGANAAPLKPGETRAFRVTFEHMPEEWNQAPPAITPVYVAF